MHAEDRPTFAMLVDKVAYQWDGRVEKSHKKSQSEIDMERKLKEMEQKMKEMEEPNEKEEEAKQKGG